MAAEFLKNSAKALVRYSGVIPLVRKFHSGTGGVPVLAYHSVSQDGGYCVDEIAVSSELFEWQCRYLAKHYSVISLDDAIDHVRERRALPDNAVCLTFDDGYLDNYTNAFPTLRKYALKATFFVVVDAVVHGKGFWVGWLNQLVINTRNLDQLANHFAIDFSGEPNRQARWSIASTINGLINQAPLSKRNELLETVARIANDCPPLASSSRLMMDKDQLREMHDNGMTIGSHSMSHPILSSFSASDAKYEMQQSKADLEQLLGAEVKFIAYPNGYGVATNFNEMVKQGAQEVGYTAAVTSIRGFAKPGDDLFALKRLNVNQRLGKSGFAYRLEEHSLLKLGQRKD